MADIIAPLVQLAIMIVIIAGFWKVFTKAGQPGWACLVPIYHAYVMLQIANKPTWWLILMIIPLVNAVVIILVYISIAEKFGKSTLFGVGMFFFSPIMVPMLGFGDAQYNQHA